MLDPTVIRQALKDKNVQAFLHLIRHGESNQTGAAYLLVNGGSHFSDSSKHPFGSLPTTEGGKAAGAYQFLPTTWARLAKAYPEDCADFGPAAQDFGAVALLLLRKALPNIIAGKIDDAIVQCRQEWTSLPGASENSGKTLAEFHQVYLQYGGSFEEQEQPSAPIEDRSTPAEQPKGPTMPLILALMPVLAQMLPQLASIFKPGVTPTDRAVGAAQAIADAVTQATGTTNLQSAIEKIQADPDAKHAASDAVNSIWFQITEVGGGVQTARAAVIQQASVPPYKNVAFLVTLLLLPAVYLVIYAVLLTPNYSEQLRTVVVTAIVLSLLGGITSYFYGTTLSSSKKDDTIAAQQQANQGV